MDQAHEHAPDVSTMLGFVEQRIFPMLDATLQAPFTNIMPPALLCRVDRETRSNMWFEKLNNAA
jgi:hypothetical protein